MEGLIKVYVGRIDSAFATKLKTKGGREQSPEGERKIMEGNLHFPLRIHCK